MRSMLRTCATEYAVTFHAAVASRLLYDDAAADAADILCLHAAAGATRFAAY